MIIPSRPRSPWLACGIAAGIAGALAALYYQQLGLTLSHYDARGHLIVARRIFDSITPGWQQIGAVWLPLPHVLNALPVQVDALYRSGASAVLLSVASFAVAASAITWIVFAITGSALASAVAAAVFALNPNVLYLQATPMTEPLLFGLMTLAVALLIEWTRTGRAAALIGWAFALACLTRYEAWPVTFSALALAAWARFRAGAAWNDTLCGVGRIAVYPLAAIGGFVVFSRVVIGQWFVSSGFFVPDNPAEGQPLVAIGQIIWSARMLSGYALVGAAAIGAIALAIVGLRDRQRADRAIALSLLATAALPWAAFMNGHPFRIRYMVPLIVVQAICAGVAAGMWQRVRPWTIVAVAMIAAFELRPIDLSAPMIVEAQWDRPNAERRVAITDCLAAGYDGETVMASMGSLGHYMQELSRAGFAIRDFLHEGNGDIWLNALRGPRPFAGWILIEEESEGGDMLAQAVRQRPGFLDGFSRVCSGAGIALYRRDSDPGRLRTRR